jgi:hypothetical protein
VTTHFLAFIPFLLSFSVNRKRKQGDESDEESDEDSYEDDDVSMLSEAEDKSASTRTRPKILDRDHWWNMKKVSIELDKNDPDSDVFHTADGDAIRCRWYRNELDYRVPRMLGKAQQSLLANQDQQSIVLVCDEFPKPKFTQVPYVSRWHRQGALNHCHVR